MRHADVIRDLPPAGLPRRALLRKAGAGFGLLGHALEMARGAGVTIEIAAATTPLLEGAEALARAGLRTGASSRNWAAYGEAVDLPAGFEPWRRDVLTDPQTSGGLLISVAEDAAGAVLQQARDAGFAAALVGPDLALEGGEGELAAQPRGRQGQVVEGRPVMVERVVAVLAAFEQRAELDGLVGLVVVHRPLVEPHEPQCEAGDEREGEQGAERRPGHLGRP